MRRMMWPAGQPEKVISDDKPVYFLRRLLAKWNWRGQNVRETVVDRPIHNPRHDVLISMACNIEWPKGSNIAYATPSDLKAVAALNALEAA